MNDKELDELLDAWIAPSAPDSLRKNVQAGFASHIPAAHTPTPWKLAFPSGIQRRAIAAILGALALLLTVTQAFSKLPSLVQSSLKIPYIVDSEFVRYAADGSPSVDLYATSFSYNGVELILSSTVPGHPFVTAIRQVLDTVGLLIFDFTRPFHAKDEQRRRAFTLRRIQNGCVDGRVVGRETILGYPTVAIADRSTNQRLTLWMAPDLACFALRLTIETRQQDGTFRLISKRQALKVQLNR